MEDSSLQAEDIVSSAFKHAIEIDWPSVIRAQGLGERESIHRGRGENFDNIRPYEATDDDRYINWKVFGETGELVVNEYVPFTQAEVFIITDVSPTMNFGTVRVTKRTLAAELTADMIVSLNNTKDLVGSMIFSRAGMETYRRPDTANTRMAYMDVASILDTQQSKLPDGVKAQSGLAETLSRLPNSRCLVFITSDFISMTEADWGALYDAGMMHDVFCFYVQDEREKKLPEPAQGKGFFRKLMNMFTLNGYLIPLQDFDGNTRYIWNTASNRAKYEANFRVFEAAILTRFKESNCRWFVISTEEGFEALPRMIEAFA